MWVGTLLYNDTNLVWVWVFAEIFLLLLRNNLVMFMLSRVDLSIQKVREHKNTDGRLETDNWHGLIKANHLIMVFQHSTTPLLCIHCMIHWALFSPPSDSVSFSASVSVHIITRTLFLLRSRCALSSCRSFQVTVEAAGGVLPDAS